MKFYRLSETSPKYGLAGNVIPHERYTSAVPWFDRALYDLIDETGSEYMYKAEVSYNKQTPALYFFDSYVDVLILLHNLDIREGVFNGRHQREMSKSQHSEAWPERTSKTITIRSYTVVITYREEWDTTKPK